MNPYTVYKLFKACEKLNVGFPAVATNHYEASKPTFDPLVVHYVYEALVHLHSITWKSLVASGSDNRLWIHSYREQLTVIGTVVLDSCLATQVTILLQLFKNF